MNFAVTVRVYIEDTDAGGIVYYVNYLKFMERARTEFMRALGYGKTAIFSDDKMFVVHSANVQYLGAARLDDELSVTAVPLKVARSNITFEQSVFRGGELLCRGEVRIACVDRATQKPCAMPDAMFEQVKQLNP
ncbi:MAG TPA: tol-pal system-associated acyl-CoA thioesterase [Pseudomonadales bacterium]|nr:tol-pal system-associated acyl-CoA thioesterase [Pseudomonadales bacterium]HNN86848.1 tol-pal system-associated acyl-CoA thioesterase [Pseudomonadales bacterium]